jgi:hypothetical protein
MAEQEFTAEELENEEWRPIERFVDYEVSSLGRVRTFRGYRGIQRRREPNFLTPAPASRGYTSVTLTNDSGRFQKLVHILVLEAFTGPRPQSLDNAFDGCHNNHNRADARLSNLRWDTHSANVAESVPFRKSSHCHKLSALQVSEIRKRFVPWHCGAPQLAREYNVSVSAVKQILYPSTLRQQPQQPSQDI